MLQVFESHAEYLGPDQFTEFALPYIKQIQERVRAQVNVPMVKELISTWFGFSELIYRRLVYLSERRSFCS